MRRGFVNQNIKLKKMVGIKWNIRKIKKKTVVVLSKGLD
jgi:hypothetical protein